MPRQAAELGALAVSRIATAGYHAVGGVAGLYLQVLPTGGRTWILRADIGGRRREMGLGGYPSVTLSGARAPPFPAPRSPSSACPANPMTSSFPLQAAGHCRR